jgi:hypothetical protein
MLGASAIETAHHGYRLVLPIEEVDAQRFEPRRLDTDLGWEPSAFGGGRNRRPATDVSTDIRWESTAPVALAAV